MKQRVQFILVLCISLGGFLTAQAQEWELSYFRGAILKHNDQMSHLVESHPQALLLQYYLQPDSQKPWQQHYNFPKYGFSLLYQDFASPILGEAYAAGVHLDFYAVNRQLQFQISQGIAYVNKPYDKLTNPKNNAFGSHLLSSNRFAVQYKPEQLVGNWGVQLGLHLQHFSNGRTKMPNSGINTVNLAVGLNYNPKAWEEPLRDTALVSIAEPLHYWAHLRGGVNESSIVGSGLDPFWHLGVGIDKRWCYSSAWQVGVDLFWTKSVDEYIRYMVQAYPDRYGNQAKADYFRLGLMAGHEWFFDTFSIETQLGTYLYKDFAYEADVYQRLGFKYYLTPRFFVSASLKSHGFRAEAVEWGGGIRL